jgi:hypothetical protein
MDMNTLLRQAAGRGAQSLPTPFEDPADEELKRQDVRIREALTAAAKSAGAKKPDMVRRLIDYTAVEFAHDGAPQNAAELVRNVREEAPELFGDPEQESSGGMNDVIRRAAGVAVDEGEGDS